AGIARAPRSNGLETVAIVGERLSQISAVLDTWMEAHPQLQAHVKGTGNSHLIVVTDEDEEGVDLQAEDIHGSLHSGRQHSILLAGGSDGRKSVIEDDGRSACVADARAAPQAVHFLPLEPAKLRLSSEPAAEITLASDGSNLPTALAALDGEARAEIRADLA